MKTAVIGFGCRGQDNTKLLLTMDDIEVVSVCDAYPDRAERAVEIVKERGGNTPLHFTDYKEALNVEGIELCFVFTGWQAHSEVAIYAMKKGIPVASEVGGEYSIDRCFELVRTHEETGTPYMLLENCCYGENELLATAMARKGLLGTISFCAGAYTHDLRSEIAYGIRDRHYRFQNYRLRCCDNYPTHDLGPIAKLLNINRGNRIKSLVAMSSAANGLKEYIATRDDADDVMKNAQFKQGDVVETLITCENGEMIRLHLDTTLPVSYTRDFTVRGTKGSYFQSIDAFFLDGDKEYWDTAEYVKNVAGNSADFKDEHMPEIWKNITAEDRKRGHGGMDYFCFRSFIDAVKAGEPMPIDVYDAATWMAVSVLTEKSIAEGGTVQYMPDFTHGMWTLREPKDVIDLV